MTVRAYTNLTRKELIERGFRQPKSLAYTYLETVVFGQCAIISFDSNSGRFYFDLSVVPGQEPLSPTNAQLAALMKPAFYTMMGIQRGLRTGLYQHRSAYCKDPCRSTAIVAADSLSDLLELVELLNTGRIPPTVSYEDPQVETLPREFRQLWREFWALVKRQLSEWQFQMDRHARTLK